MQNMGWAILADAVLLLHGAFIAWVALGALAVWRWPRLVWAHLPALAWGVWIELSGRLCPLTALEDELRHRAGQQGQPGGFVERTLLPLLYPDALTRPTQWMLAAGVVLVNAALYAWIWRRRRRISHPPPGP